MLTVEKYASVPSPPLNTTPWREGLTKIQSPGYWMEKPSSGSVNRLRADALGAAAAGTMARALGAAETFSPSPGRKLASSPSKFTTRSAKDWDGAENPNTKTVYRPRTTTIRVRVSNPS